MPVDLPKSGLVARLTTAGGPFRLEEVQLPDLRPGEALLKVEACTICASDLRTFRGERAAPSSGLLGHEIVGTIAAARAGELRAVDGSRLIPGDRVVCGVAASCGSCRYCHRGIPQKCVSLRKFGHAPDGDRWQLSGGFSEYCHLPVGAVLARASARGAAFQSAWLGCAGATAAAAIRRAGELQDRSVIVLGSGAVGLFVASQVAARGARVAVVDQRTDRLELAESLGVARTFQLAAEGDLDTFVHGFTEERGADLVFETSGSNSAVEAALGLTDLGGKVVLVGSVAPSEPIGLHPEKVVTSLQSIEGVHNYAPEDLGTAMVGSAMLTETIPARFPRFRLAEIDAAFEAALSGVSLRVAVEPAVS